MALVLWNPTLVGVGNLLWNVGTKVIKVQMLVINHFTSDCLWCAQHCVCSCAKYNLQFIWKRQDWGRWHLIFPVIYSCVCVCMLNHFSSVWLCATLWTVACQTPLSMGFCRQKYWSGLLCLLLGNLPHSGIEPSILHFLHWQAGPYHLNLLGSPQTTRHNHLTSFWEGRARWA